MNHEPIVYNYWRLTGPALLVITVFLLVRYWNHLPGVARWVRRQYRALPAQLQGLLWGYLAVGLAQVWLRVLHWPKWLLIALSAGAVVYSLARYVASVRAEQRDLDKRIRQMLDKNKRDVLTVAMLLTVIRLTLYKHGGWLTATALLSLACGMAA